MKLARRKINDFKPSTLMEMLLVDTKFLTHFMIPVTDFFLFNSIP